MVLYVSMILREQPRRINHRPITPAQLVNFKQIRVALLPPFFQVLGKNGRQGDRKIKAINESVVHITLIFPPFSASLAKLDKNPRLGGGPIGQIIVVQCVFSGTPKDICAVPVEFPEFDAF